MIKIKIYYNVYIMAMCNDSPHFDKNKNDYYTTKSMWENITHIVPKHYVIWEACMLNSKSKSIEYWKELGYNCIGDNTIDCLENNNLKYDIIITNPPFNLEIKSKILKKFVEIDKPFIIILNVMNIFSKYIRDIFKDKLDKLQIIYPNGKIKFEIESENNLLRKCKDPAFYCCYVCYKMNIKNEDLYLK